jgi:hypothetical protein
MRRSSAATSILVITLLAVGGLASVTLAQDASSTTADSPVVGAWLLGLGSDMSSAPTTAVFQADGTYIQTDGAETAVGSWTATGPTSGDLTFTAYQLTPEGEVGSATVRGSVEVAPDGTLTGTFSLEYGGATGTPSGEYGPATVTATRIGIEPMGSDLIPMGPMPSPAS